MAAVPRSMVMRVIHELLLGREGGPRANRATAAPASEKRAAGLAPA